MEMRKLLEQIAATAELMGSEISPGAAMMMAQDLAQYRPEIVAQALAGVRREPRVRFSLGSVIEQIERVQPDGRPGAEEAWAMIPRDEATSVVMTQEMAKAWGIVKPLLDGGDQVGARMAFREIYIRLVDDSKRSGIRPKWFPSLGDDKSGRDPVLAEAVRLGRIGAEHAIGLIAPHNADIAREGLAKIKKVIADSKFSQAAS